MCPEGNAPSSSSPPRPAATSSPSGKRARDPEDEVYVDNLHSHKRYLSEIMASSLNGLKVGDPLSINLVDSSLRDDISLQYSPMSEDSDDSRYCESSANTCSSLPESIPTSPVSPYRCQKPPTGFASGPPSTSHGCIVSSVASTQSRHRGSDNEGRFPSSPSDICHSADLRRAALLRSVQMRAHPLELSQFESPYSPGQESGNNMESEEPCSCTMAVLDGNGHQIAKCAPLNIGNHDSGVKSSCRNLAMNLKDEGSAG